MSAPTARAGAVGTTTRCDCGESFTVRERGEDKCPACRELAGPSRRSLAAGGKPRGKECCGPGCDYRGEFPGLYHSTDCAERARAQLAERRAAKTQPGPVVLGDPERDVDAERAAQADAERERKTAAQIVRDVAEDAGVHLGPVKAEPPPEPPAVVRATDQPARGGQSEEAEVRADGSEGGAPPQVDDFGRGQPAPVRVGPRLWVPEAPVRCNHEPCRKWFWQSHPAKRYCRECENIPSGKCKPVKRIPGRGGRFAGDPAPAQRPERPPEQRAHATSMRCARCGFPILPRQTVDVAKGKFRHSRAGDCAAAERAAREADAVVPEPDDDELRRTGEPVQGDLHASPSTRTSGLGHEGPRSNGNGPELDDPVTPKLAEHVDDLTRQVAELRGELADVRAAIEGAGIEHLRDVSLAQVVVALARIGRGELKPEALLPELGVSE